MLDSINLIESQENRTLRTTSVVVIKRSHEMTEAPETKKRD